MTWYKDEKGRRIFRGGREDLALAAETAAGCNGFVIDDEDERVSDEERSCYNCRYRRWTVESFACLLDPKQATNPRLIWA